MDILSVVSSFLDLILVHPIATILITTVSLILYSVGGLIKDYLVCNKKRKLLSNIPGPERTSLLFGNAKLFFDEETKKPSTHKVWTTLLELGKKYDGMFKLSFGPSTGVYIYRADYVEALLSKMSLINKSIDYDVMGEWLGSGLLTSKGDKWKHQRKLLTPTFHFKILEDFIPVMNEQSMVLRDKLALKGDNRDVVDYLSNCTLDIIMETAMGVKIDCQNNSDVPYRKALSKYEDLLLQRLLNPIYYWQPLFYVSSLGRQYYKEIATMKSFTSGVIAQRLKETVSSNRHGTPTSDDNANSKRKAKRLVFLDLLLELHIKDGSLTIEEIREQMDTFTFGGHDTTGFALTYALYLLGRHPDAQDKVHQELDEIFNGDSERFVTFTDTKRMVYLEAVMKESLRLYPSAPMIVRNLAEDLELDGGQVLPKSTDVAVPFFLLHRDEAVFPEPEKFDPERFTADNPTRHPFAYCPFSAGPRNCIGQKFAHLEKKIVIANILRKYSCHSLDPPENLKLSIEMILKPKCPVRIVFKERTA